MKEMVFKVVGVACLTLLSGVANSQQAQSEGAKVAESAESSHGHLGRMVVIDPETGEISKKTPTQEEVSKFKFNNKNSAITIPNNEMKFIQMPNGRTKIELNGRFQKMVNVSIDESGNLDIGHHVELDQTATSGAEND